MTKQQDELPPAPKLKQDEFTHSNLCNSDDIVQATEGGGDRTPLSLIIPTFDSINMLPTPMVYTPPSMNSRSPMGQTLNLPKRRGGEIKLLQRFEGGSQLRVVSELQPFPDALQQRVSSLPTVNEASSTSEEHLIKSSEFEEEDIIDDGDEVVTGFVLDDLTKPLKWKKVKEIGSGNFSNVYLYKAICLTDSKLKHVCIKRIKYPTELQEGKDRQSTLFKDLLSRLESSLTRELGILQSINHPCIVKLYGINNPVFVQSKKPLRDLLHKNEFLPRCDMIMSYCVGGDLLMAASSCNGNLELWLIQRIFTELVLAIQYLHNNQVIHRDLKLENILLKYSLEEIYQMKDTEEFMRNNIIELCDFGLCKKIEKEELCTARCGSEDYVSPEILMGVPYDGRISDTWALGVILYGLLEDRLPFDPPPNASSRQRNRATSHRIARYEWKWFRLADKNIDAKEIVEHTLARKTQRWNIDDIFNSSFVKDLARQLNF